MTKRTKIYDKRFVTRHWYRDLIKKPKYKTMSEKTYSKYRNIVIKTIQEWILKGNIFILPFNLGSLYIEKNKVSMWKKTNNGIKLLNRSVVNWKATKELREQEEPNKSKEYWLLPENRDKYIVPYDYSHTDNYIYKMKWLKDRKINEKIKKRILELFTAKQTQDIKSKLTKILLSNKKIPKYYERKIYDNSIHNREIRKKIDASNTN